MYMQAQRFLAKHLTPEHHKALTTAVLLSALSVPLYTPGDSEDADAVGMWRISYSVLSLIMFVSESI